MALCTNCVWNNTASQSCSKAVLNYPNADMCVSFIMRHSPPKQVVRPIEREVFSSAEPTKCTFYSLLP